MTIKREHTITIDRPVHEVFSYLARIENLAQWQGSMVEARQDGDGPVGVGTKGKVTLKFAGRKWESDLEVSEYELDRRIGFRASAPVPGHFEFILEPAGRVTKATARGSVEPGGFFKLAEPILARTAQRHMQADVETLKDILEAQT